MSELLVRKAASFDLSNISSISACLALLGAWVKANVKYSLLLKKIQSISDDLLKAERELEACRCRLAVSVADMKQVQQFAVNNFTLMFSALIILFWHYHITITLRRHILYSCSHSHYFKSYVSEEKFKKSLA